MIHSTSRCSLTLSILAGLFCGVGHCEETSPALPTASQNVAVDESGETWQQWRGPKRDGKIPTGDWPDSLAGQLSESWTFAAGPSYSGPIVSRDLVYTTETKDKKWEVVRALDRKSGEQVWEQQWEGAMRVPFFAAANGSWIRATPTLDEDRLYVAGMKDVLVCLDAASGDIRWKRDFVAETGSAVPQFGFVSSPLVVGDNLVVQAGGATLMLDKMTGKTKWTALKDGGGMYGSAFSSPVFATIHGVPQLVVQTRAKLAGLMPGDGKVLWSIDIPAFRGMNILTPTVLGDRVFTSSYGGKSTMLTVEREGDSWNVTKAWQHKSQGYMSSPVVIDNHIYLHLRNQRLVCLDVATGTERWTTTPFGKYWSMVASNDKLLALDQRGDLLLIEPSEKEFVLKDKIQVASDSWAHLAIVGDEVFVRDLKSLKAFRWGESASSLSQ